MIREFLLVLLDASIEFVGERVDGGVHVLIHGVGVNLPRLSSTVASALWRSFSTVRMQNVNNLV